MILELVRKELIYKNEHTKDSPFAAFRFLLKLVVYGLLFGLIWFIFANLDKKIASYSSGASYNFLVLFLFIIMVISLISATVRSRIAIFSKKDARITLTLPIPIETLIISKVIYIYIKEVINNFILSLPLLLSFGFNREMTPSYYVFSIFYPLIISIFSVSLALIVVVIVQHIYYLISSNSLIQFLLAVILVIGLCYAYQFVLEMFLNALNDSSIGGVFSPSFIKALDKINDFLVPVNQILAIVILKENILPNILMFVGILLMTLVLGIFVISLVYMKHSKQEINVHNLSNKETNIKIHSLTYTLFKKELLILFKNSANVFSYTSLLIMAPFLSFVVISSLDKIMYGNLSFVLTYYPELINGINIALILLFVGVINSSASLSMSREGKAIQIIKYIPVSPVRQIAIKLLSPLFLSSLSLMITLLVLIFTKSITMTTLVISFVLGFILIAANNLLGIEWDMKDKGEKKTSISLLNGFLAIGFPTLILLIHIILSFSLVNNFVIYLLEVTLGIALAFFSLVNIKNRYRKAFRKMEVN